MASSNLSAEIKLLIEAIDELIPSYMANPVDYEKSNGNAALCIIEEHGNVYGKMYGTDRIKMRHAQQIAWRKASQVWITGIKTGEYEKLVFNGQIDYHDYGINMPDFIGYQGGQPVTLKGDVKLSVGFSGFRGSSDIEIVTKALSLLK